MLFSKKNLLSFALIGMAASLAAFDLVKNGKALHGIAADGNAPGLELAKNEIIFYTKKVTGQDISKLPPRIIVSTVKSKNIPPDIKNALARRTKSDEAYYMGSIKGKFYIVGTTGVGAWYGACDFIERFLGVRFYTPYEDGTLYKPKKSIWVSDTSRVDFPFFPVRLVDQVGTGGFDQMTREWAGHNRIQAPGPWGIKDSLIKYVKFHEQRMRMNRVREGGHLTFYNAVPPQKYNKTHPHYFALSGGKRNTNTLHHNTHHCMSNPEVQDLVCKYIIDHIDKYGDHASFAFGAPDSTKGWCECENCVKMDKGNDLNVSRRFHTVTQQIARKVYEKRPGARLWTWAYANYRDLFDGLKVDERMSVVFCPHGRCYAHTLDDPKCSHNVPVYKLLLQWLKISRKIQIYEYDMCCPYGYEPYEEVAVKDIKLYKKLGLLGRKHEIYYPHTRFGKNTLHGDSILTSKYGMLNKWQFWYLFGKATWNPDLDYEKTLAQIESDFYGKCYPVMKKYHDLRRKLWRETPGCMGYPFGDQLTPLLLQKAGAKETLLKYLAEATKLAKGDARLEKQIALEKAMLEELWIKPADKYRKALGRRLAAPEAFTAPVIDGKGDDKVWSTAFYVTDFKTSDDNKFTPIGDKLATSAGFLSDNKNLYILIQAKEPSADKLTSNAVSGKQAMAKIWDDDHFEIFIVPQNEAMKYYQFAVNAKGGLLQLEQPGTVITELGAVVKTGKTGEGFTIEMKIPVNKLEGLFAPGLSWKVNVGRTRRIKDGLPATHWSIDGTGFHSQIDFRNMVIGSPVIRNGSFEEGKDKRNFPKYWGVRGPKGKSDLIKLPSGRTAFHLKAGNALSHIVYGKYFMGNKDVKVTLTIKVSGKGTLIATNGRYKQINPVKGLNKQVKVETFIQKKLSSKPSYFKGTFTIHAGEFSQLAFLLSGKNAECIIEGVSATVE